jgi:two-component system NtrC family response regulator
MSPELPSPGLEPTAYSQPPKLLIVDDEEDIRTQMKWALAQEYTVGLAEDRRSAMEVVEREKPVVVTLDLGLPPRPADAEEGFATLSEILSTRS